MQALIRLKGVLPFIIVVFLNAFVDLGHKIIVQNTIFKVYDGGTQVILIAIVNALILLPFILLFTPSGFLADRFPKNNVMRVSAGAAVMLTLLITLCYYQGWFWMAFAMTFLLAMQSAIYSPSKYGYIKFLAGKERLAQLNGIVQAITIIAILAGGFAFSKVFETQILDLATLDKRSILLAIAPLGWLLVANSVIELIMAYRMPTLESQNDIKFNWQGYLKGGEFRRNIKIVFERKTIYLSIIGLSVFWAISQVLLAAFPSYAKEALGVTNTVLIQGVLACSGLGIMVGSLLAGNLSRRYIETGLIPIGAAGLSLCLILLPGLSNVYFHAFNFFVLGIAGGLFIVPLNALIQFQAGEHEMGKILAGNNLVQNITMVGFLVLTVVFVYFGVSTVGLMFLTAVVAVIGTIYTVYKIPQSLVRFIVGIIFSINYRIKVQGFKNIPSRGGVLMLGNHISWIDWAVIQIACPRPIRFVMLKSIYERWYLKWFFKIFGVIPITSGAESKVALKQIAQLLDAGEVVCLFPEGVISRNGHLAEFRSGFEKACQMVTGDIKILPFYLRGLWGSRFSRSSERLKKEGREKGVRDIIVAFGEALEKDIKADVLKRRVFDLSASSWNEYVKSLPTIPQAWIDTVKKRSSNMAVADTLSEPLNAASVLSAAIVFGRKISHISSSQNIGLLLPTSSGAAISNMAVLMQGKTVVNLNYSASEEALKNAVSQAGLTEIYTSRRFIEKLSRKGIDFDDLLSQVSVQYLEDIKSSISKFEMLKTFCSVKLLPAFLLKLMYCKARDSKATAAILFSSGSEGMPKGVMLSHENLMANLKQVSDVLNIEDEDAIMASLPFFHAFGLTVTLFMPLIEGFPMICHADPTDALNIAKAVAKYRATLLLGTSTFLRLYIKNRKVHPLMFESLRLVIAGAEKLSDDVRENFKMKFNKDIMEGYGATETAPVASVNLPDHMDISYWQVQKGCKIGTVGMPLPGTSFKVVDPQTLQELPSGEDGLILIGGAQLMQGYLNNPEKTADVIIELDNARWYKTGDKGHLDEAGYLTIVDRYSRFAKLGGEMVSLGAVESEVHAALSNLNIEGLELIVINLPDDKKGEKLVLLFSCESDFDQDIKRKLIDNGTNPLMIPADYYQVKQIPKLGSGKTDFSEAKALALSLSNK